MVCAFFCLAFQPLQKLVAVRLVAVQEQQQARLQETVDAPGTGFPRLSASPTTTTIGHSFRSFSDITYV